MRKLAKIDTGQKMLLKCLWIQHGGPSAVARKLKFVSSNITNWTRDGYVPLEDCAYVSKILKVPIEALNYKEIKPISEQVQAPQLSWRNVIDLCDFPKEVVKEIWACKRL